MRLFDALEPEKPLSGPALIESPTTTVVIELGATVERKPSGSLAIRPTGESELTAGAVGAQVGEGAG